MIYFQDKHEDNHQPKLHGGLVIKHNANQRYATNAITAFIFREIAERHNLPVQVCLHWFRNDHQLLPPFAVNELIILFHFLYFLNSSVS